MPPVAARPSPGAFSFQAEGCRRGAPWWRHLLVLSGLIGIAAGLLHVIGDVQVWALHRLEVLVALGGIAFWRWSWFLLQNLRAMIYRYYTFPRLRRAAQKAVLEHGPIPEVTILATTYHEKPWITNPVFESIFSELAALEGLCRRPKVVVVTGCDDDDRNIKAIFDRCCLGEDAETRRGADAFRVAGHGFRKLETRNSEPGTRFPLASGIDLVARG